MPEDKTAPAPPKRGYSVLNRSTSKKVPRHDSNQELDKADSPKGNGTKKGPTKKLQDSGSILGSPRNSGKSPRTEETQSEKYKFGALPSWGTTTDLQKKNAKKSKKDTGRRKSLDEDDFANSHSDPVKTLKVPKKDNKGGVFMMATPKGGRGTPGRSSMSSGFFESEPLNVFLQIRDFKNQEPAKMRELLGSLTELPPTEDETIFLGIIRQMCELYDVSACRDRRSVTETLLKIKPSKLALQTLLILAANGSDEAAQRKAANLLTSFVAGVFSSPDFVGGRTVFDDIMKESEYLVWAGIHDSSPFIQSSLASMQQLIEFVPLSSQISQATASEEAIKREFEKKSEKGSFVLLTWLLCCMNSFKLIVEDSKITDTILEALKKETGLLKALALVVLFRLYMSAKFKTSSSLLQEIADQSQDSTIANMAVALRSAQKNKAYQS